jgi:hypothetical protein
LNNAPPGGDLRHTRDLGQIVDTALKVYRQNFGEFLAIAAVTVPIGAIGAVVGSLISDKVVSVIVTVAFSVPSAVISLVAVAAIVRGIADVAEGVPPDFNYVYSRVLKRLGTLFLTLLRILVIFVALCITVVGIPFAIYLTVRWAFFTQAIIIEGESPSGAMSLSASAVQDRWWRTLGILLILGLLASLPTGIVSLIFSAAAPIAGSLASVVVGAVVLPFSATASTLLFFDLQSRKAALASVGDAGLPGD